MTSRPDVLSFFHNDTNTWSHIVVDTATRAAAIIDPVLDFDLATRHASADAAQKLLAVVLERNLNVAWLLETHTHADHLSASDWLKRKLIDRHMAPRVAIGAGVIGLQQHFCDVIECGPQFVADGSQFDRLFHADEHFRIGELDAQVMATPGHTPDGVSYLIGDAVFVGDTLFSPEAGTGRCDFPGGDAATQFRSIQRLYELPETTRVFLCHDYPISPVQPAAQSTIAAEKLGNIHVRGSTSQADYVALRTRRDTALTPPRLLYPALQMNICAGQVPLEMAPVVFSKHIKVR